MKLNMLLRVNSTVCSTLGLAMLAKKNIVNRLTYRPYHLSYLAS